MLTHETALSLSALLQQIFQTYRFHTNK